MNNADLAVQELRKVQEYVFDKNASPASIFDVLEKLSLQINKASKQINGYESQLTSMLNILQQEGMLTSKVLAAFTGAGIEEAEKMIEAQDEIAKKIEKK